MKDQLATRLKSDRSPNRPNPWIRWLGEYRQPAFPASYAEPTEQPGSELLSVAHATLTWWEKHKNDTVVVDGQVNFRYEFKPRFVTHAQEVIKKAQRN